MTPPHNTIDCAGQLYSILFHSGLMVIVEASLSSTVFFPGDTLFCRVVVTSKNEPSADVNPPSNELISWVSVQFKTKYGGTISLFLLT